jgi:Tol biopolymer transport system component
VLHDQAAPLPASVPAALRTIVDKALEKDPANRFQSMRDMVVDLRRLTRSSEEELSAPATARATRARRYVGAALTLSALAIAAIAWWASRSHQAGAPRPQEYTKLTNFADSVTSPALSPDGRMLTFIRGNSTFFGEGQVYVKLLTDGEPVRLTNDDLRKMSPKFSPDGARIAYSTTSIDFTRFETWVVPVLGGQPQKLLANAEGMTWIAQPRAQSGSQPLVLFSELTGRGPQMSIVASTESRAAQRSVYAPPLEVGGMAHRSVASPDGRSVIVIEMDFRSWLPCRLVPFDGSSTGTPVGPAPAQCTDAAWSPDGKWMYFSANTGTDGVHTWRQRFPNGTPEQITFGVTDEEGIHVAPDARSFVTSIGTSQSTVWIHDANGDRQMTSEGFSYLPSIAADGKKLFYLVRSGGVRNWHAGALWVADLQSGQRQRVLPDFLMQNYRISEDSRRVVFTAVDGTGHTPLWLASLDGDTPPRRLATLDAILPSFGAPGTIVFGSQDPAYPFLYQVREDGGDPQPFVPVPMLMPFAVSPGGRLVTVMDVQRFGAVVVFKAGSSDSIKLCDACTEPQGTDPIPPPLSWTPDGRFVYFRFSKSMYAIPLPPGQLLPPIPPSGFASEDAVAALPGAKLLSREAIYPGPKPSLYAFTKLATQRNIYRVPVP